MNIDDIVNGIVNGNLNNSDMNRVIEAIKLARRLNSIKTASAFRVGQSVTFATRSGRNVNARIIKINTKTIKCVEDGATTMVWNVSPSFLKAV